MSDKNEFYTHERVSDMINMSGLVNPKLFDVIALLPKGVVDFVVEKCLILTLEEEDGLHWNMEDTIFENKTELIVLNPSIWQKDQKSIALIVAHEVAHAVFGHKIKSDQGRDLPQEVAADKQAVEWLSAHWPKAELLRLCIYLK